MRTARNVVNPNLYLMLPILGISLFIFTGCFATGRIIDNSRLQYTVGTFNAEAIRTEGLAILPIVWGQGQEGARRFVADKLSKYLTEVMPPEKIAPALQTMDSINNANLSESYANLIRDYEQAAILNKTNLAQIGRAVGYRYLLYVRLIRFEPKFHFNMFGQVWDTEVGDVVWEAIADVSWSDLSQSNPFRDPPDAIIDYGVRKFLSQVENLPISQVIAKTAHSTKTPLATAEMMAVVWGTGLAAAIALVFFLSASDR